MIITEQDRVENRREHLVQFRIDVVCGMVVIGLGETKEVAETDGVGVGCVEDAGKEIVQNSVAGGVAWESCGAIVDVRKEREREEAAKVLIGIESGGGGDVEYIAAAFSDGWRKLLQDGLELFGDGKGHEEFDEVFFPSGLGPGVGVGRWGRADENIGDEEVGIDYGHVIHGNRSGRGLRVFAVVDELGHRRREGHHVHNDGNEVRKNINDPFIGGGVLGGGVRLEESQNVGGVLRDLDILEFKGGSFLLE